VLEKGDSELATLLDVMKSGVAGMQHFDGEIIKLVRAGVINLDNAVAYASDPVQLRSTMRAAALGH
jgi:Tfp pilus assembly ATPase PilU